MPKQLNWNKKTFSNLFKIYSKGQQVGKLNSKSFSSNASAEFNNEKYTFITSGFFDPTTKIYDLAEKKFIGKIIYNSWRTKATINLNDKISYWKYENIWNTKWRISDEEGIQISYQGSSSGGNIQTNTDDSLLLLSGLFIINYYWQTSIVIFMVILIPIFLNN